MKIYCTARNAASATIQFEDDTSQPVVGSIRGPFCKYSRTLPTTVPIRDGCALVVDPCYWTPKLPFRYEVTMSGTGSNEPQQFMWGIRWCMPHKRNLLLDGKGYVVRAAQWDEQFELEAYRELGCALLASSRLHSGIYERASELGVLIVDTVAADDAGRHVCVASTLEPSVHFNRAIPTDSLVPHKCDALRMASVQDGDTVSEVGWVTESQLRTRTLGDISRPLLVERSIGSADLADMRRACDKLQSDLAPLGQFAGYLVSSSA